MYMTLLDEQKVDGIIFRTHRFIEKRQIARALPTENPAMPHYIAEKTDIHQLEIVLENKSVIIEPGALQYMHGQLQAEVIQHETNKSFIARAVASAGTGESAHGTKYSGSGFIWCEPTRKHLIIATMDSEADALLLDDKAFYACSSGINLTTHKHQNISGVLSGNGFVQPKLSGKGIFAIESPVPVEEIQIVEIKAEEELIVDGDFMLMYSASLSVEICPLVKDLRNIMRSGEGLVYKIKGQGQAWLTPTSRIS